MTRLYFIGLLLSLPLGVFGWVWNVYKVTQTDFYPMTGMLAVRCIGVVFPPLGAVVGYF